MFKSIKASATRLRSVIDALEICSGHEQQIALVDRLLEPRTRMSILSFINANAANIMWRDDAFYRWFMDSDKIVRDGSGILMLMQMFSREPGDNINGTDFIPLLLERADKQLSIAIYGTREPFLGEARQQIQAMGFETVHLEDGFQDDHHYVNIFNRQQPDIILLAMGMPKQNRVASLLASEAGDTPALVINGGGIIDFMSERHSRAPRWMRKAGIEFLYRFLNEPARLWKRVLIGKPLFIWRSFLTRVFAA